MILNLDCRHGLAMLPDDSVSSIICDPPYGISFMGKKWDYDVPPVEIWAECLRVLKPGGYLLAFAGTRTQHRMAVRIEDAGLEIRDMIAWVYGSGYPKHRSSLKPAMEPITLARKPAPRATLLNIDACLVGERYPANLIHDGSDEALEHFPDSAGSGGSVPNVKISGYGDGVVGTGSAEYLGGERIKVDCGTGSAARFFKECKGCYNDDLWHDLNLPSESASIADKTLYQLRQVAVSALVHAVNAALPEGRRCVDLFLEHSTNATGSELKRISETVMQLIGNISERFWQESKPVELSLPLNHANCAVHLMPTGITTITVSHWKLNGAADPAIFNIMPTNSEAGAKGLGLSTDSRFIYCAKASKRDRNEGLDHFPAIQTNFAAGTGLSKNGDGSPRNQEATAKNPHPTVKPTELMRYLCRLVTPAGGLIVDPFAGSGSTGKAATLEGFQFIGFELDPQYAAIANARIDAARASMTERG